MGDRNAAKLNMSKGCGLNCCFFIMAISIERKWYGTGGLLLKIRIKR
jgi:hypothetical protein